VNRQSETEALVRAIPPAVAELGRTLRAHGHRAWAVGGSVRDIVLSTLRGQTLDFQGDWDVATDARPEQVKKAFRKVIPTGIAHGTVTVLLGSASIEVTTLRGERGHSDGRRPDEVFFVEDLESDLARRDFTVNAMAFDLETQKLEDPFGGRLDLERGLIRAVGEPALRYYEDGLRPLRGARFSAQLEMEIESETLKAIRPSLDRFRLVSKERVRDEWFKALRTREPSRFLRVLCSEGLLEATLPELAPSEFGLAESRELEATFRTVDAAVPEPIRRLAHFLGPFLKSQFQSGEDRANGAEQIAQTLRLSNKERVLLVLYIRTSELPPLESRLVRRYLAALGREFVPLGLSYLHEQKADPTLLALAQAEFESGAPLSTKELAISGRELVEAGHEPGRELGRVLEALFQTVLDDPSQNLPEVLMERARAIRSSAADARP
jgi:tRNA nucleotidyltransferase (CCA-adding enzyme)